MTWFDVGKGFTAQRGVEVTINLEPNSNVIAFVLLNRVNSGNFATRKFFHVSFRNLEDFQGVSVYSEWLFRSVWHPAQSLPRDVLRDGTVSTLGFTTIAVVTPFISDEVVTVYENFGSF